MKYIKLLLSFSVALIFSPVTAQINDRSSDTEFYFENMPDTLPGTMKLTWQGDLSVRMLDGLHQFVETKINESVFQRSKLWHRNFQSVEAYHKSVDPNRERFGEYIGLENKTTPMLNWHVGFADEHPPVSMEKIHAADDPELVAETPLYQVYQVRWTALNRVHGEGLLLQPKSKPLANIVAIPDADQSAEQFAGLSPGIPDGSQFARQMAENGCQVLIPQLISRNLIFPGKLQQQTSREWIYRQAFHAGHHLIGFEVQKILSAIDWFKSSVYQDLKIGVAGYHEGGLIAFYSAAVDQRIEAVLVSGYFNSRQQIWDEPIYRNVWGLLSEFGDAEIASLIAPRALIIEHSQIPAMVETLQGLADDPQQVGGLPYTGYKGQLHTPAFAYVQDEYLRIDDLVKPGFQERHLISGQHHQPVSFGSPKALEKFIGALGITSGIKPASNIIPDDQRQNFLPRAREVRQIKELDDQIQWLLRDSDQERNRFFLYKIMPEFERRTWSSKSYHPFYDPGHFIERCQEYRKYFREDILGKWEDPMLSPNPRTRKLYDKERWTGYEVVLDVYSNVFASGIILIPKDLQPGEERPVVVCQHGRGSTPHELVEGNRNYYNDVAARLADQGFIVYAPQNPYRGEDRYRWLDRKANTLKKTLFSFIIAQHEQTLQWLGSLPFVDKERIAFYGLSYGGETAMRVPAVLEGYCLSICSGDFGDWTRKVMDTHNKVSFMNTLEWEMPYFNMGQTFSYAEMAYLIFPRPFMVERGHDDLVQPDEWVAYEYAKVKYLYDQFNLGDKTTIEYFNGGHSMRCEGTFDFLHKHLSWP